MGLLLAFSGGCDPAGEPLEPGRYTYRASHPAPGGDEPITLEGVLTIEEAEGDTIEGYWEVPQLHPELRVVDDADDVLVVTAHPVYFGTFHHRISRTRRGIACSGRYVWVAEGGVERSVLLECHISPGAKGIAPLLDTGGVPAVRPIDADTVAPR